MRKKNLSFLSMSCLSFCIACSNNNKTDLKNEHKSFLQATNQKTEISVNEWKFPELSQKEKQNLIDSVKIVFNDFYVHRTQKKNEYGFDSQAAANKLSADMSSETLLRNINAIFNNIHDLHTGFRYPVPAQCVLGGFPLSVRLVYELDENSALKEKLVIQSKLSNTLESKFATAQDKTAFAEIQPGDEILAISNLGLEGLSANELNVQDALKELEKVSRGANADAAKTRAVQIFFSRNGAYMKPPSGRFGLRIKHVATQKVTFHEFPWIVYKSPSAVCANIGLEKKLGYATTRAFQKTKSGIDEEKFQDLYATDDTDENISKKIIESNDHKKFALVHIKAFVPAQVAGLDEQYLQARKKIINEVNDLRDFVLEHREEIDGLIFDVRDNGGGYGVFPQLIANAFTTEFVSNLMVQPLVSQTNHDTFQNLEFSRYFKRLGTNDPLVDNNNIVLTRPRSDTANEMDMYLNSAAYANTEVILSPADRFDEDENDAMPPEYTPDYKKSDTEQSKETKYTLKEIFTDKPVAVLTNSNCYSSCDIFVSIMKDYEIAKIIGETEHTGGGGANVVEWENFLKPVTLDAEGTKGSIIPNGKELPAGSTIRFAWNRIVRAKAFDQANERYIEGGGVLISKENVYRPTLSDVFTNDGVIFEKIMNDMVMNRSTYRMGR